MAQSQVVRGVSTSVSTDESGVTHVTYHSTQVVSFNAERVVLRTGGWASNTTKLRMNQAANQFSLGFQVYQKAYLWYVTTKAGTFQFIDRIFKFDRETGEPIVD